MAQPGTSAAASNVAEDFANLSDMLLSGNAEPAPAAAEELPPDNEPTALPTDSESKLKRGPGRPSSTPPAPRVNMVGVVKTPQSPDNRLELGSDKPLAFKRLFAFFNALKAENIHIHATKDTLYIYTEDHQMDLLICVEIDGSKLNHYYCEKPFWLCVDRASIGKIFANIDKTYHKIRMRCTHSDPMTLEVHFHDLQVKKMNTFPLTIKTPQPCTKWTKLTENAEKCINGSLVSWVVTQKMFKKTHEIASQTTEDKIRIELVQGDNLKLRYQGCGIPQFVEEYTSPDKISLVSGLGPGEVFSVNYSVHAGKTLSSANPAETLSIHCAQDLPIIFRSYKDGITITTAMERMPDP
jgi:hypothetical protein